MLCCGDMKIVHATLHRSVRQALDLITRENVIRVIRAADRALRRLGITTPKSPSAASTRMPAKAACSDARRSRSSRPRSTTPGRWASQPAGPFGADTMFHLTGIDAFVVMLHDQGHIAAKLMARNATAA